jgi:hypothetical protein
MKLLAGGYWNNYRNHYFSNNKWEVILKMEHEIVTVVQSNANERAVTSLRVF